ncbi:MAG: M12 family metallo-peptidase [Acidobacteriota bacterium]
MSHNFGRLYLSAFALAAFFCVGADAQSGAIWTQVGEASLQQQDQLQRQDVPRAYRTFRLDKQALIGVLDRAPDEFARAERSADSVITLPMPDGSLAKFRFEHSLVVERGLLDKYPELGRTYRAVGIDDPTASARFDLLASGFHAIVLSRGGTVLVDPYTAGDVSTYITYDKADAPRSSDFSCDFDDQNAVDGISTPSPARFEFAPDAVSDLSSGTQLRTYRLALAATNEYAAAVGGNTIAGTLAAQVLIMNRVNGVYEREVAIHMNIVANNNLLIYAGDQLCGTTPVACTSANDPYTNNNGSTMLGENQTNLNALIGTANYDIGHVFSTGGGGVATLNGPCGASKARGVTGLSNPVGDAFAIDYVAHEMGHQWGGVHTFNGSVSNCSGGNRSSSGAYEPGSGITIMAYAGICGNQNLATHSIDTFHVKSLEQIIAYSQTGNGNTCAVTTPSLNTPPVVSVVGGASFNVPMQTPFALTAAATDANGDSITYDWQEYDLGAATTAVPNTDATGAMPIFRPYLPTTGGTRTFPSMQYVLANANVPPSTYGNNLLTGELMPSIARTMTFQVIARDNRAGTGGISTTTATVAVDAASGPFVLTGPNTAVTWTPSSSQSVTWNVANTTAAPVSAANVKISLSTDGGQTFPTVLAASTPNDGLETITVPNVLTTQARIKIEAVGNIFFDVSNADFTISTTAPPTGSKRFDFDGDGKADVSVFRSGTWYLLQSQNGFAAGNWGIATDKLVAADYDGDGKTDLAVFRDGDWYVQRSQAGILITHFGSAGDIPIAGDFTGDGKADLTVYRAGVWYIYDTTNGSYSQVQFGIATDKPLTGDFDGDGKQDPAVYRNGVWYVLGSQQGFFAVSFGIASDTPLPADYDGDGKTDFAVYRGGTWYLQQSTAGFTGFSFGIAADVPVPADYDGDGKADPSVFRDGNWYQSRTGSGFTAVQFGIATDKAVPAQGN